MAIEISMLPNPKVDSNITNDTYGLVPVNFPVSSVQYFGQLCPAAIVSPDPPGRVMVGTSGIPLCQVGGEAIP